MLSIIRGVFLLNASSSHFIAFHKYSSKLLKMSFAAKFVQTAQRILPSPFTIAILLTFFTFLLALVFTGPSNNQLSLRYQGQQYKVAAGESKIIPSKSLPQEQIKLRFSKQGTIIATALFEQSVKDIHPNSTLRRTYTLLDTTVRLHGDILFKGSLRFSNQEQINIEQSSSSSPYFIQLLSFWEAGFFNFLKFAMQMMLILVLGHVLALTKPVNALIVALAKHCNTTAKAAYIVCFVSILVAFFNWGLALIVGAIFARKVGEQAVKNKLPLNYPLVGAAGYAGLMVWHGGLSGSAPLIVAESGHTFEAQIGQIPFSETVFSMMNLSCMLMLIVCVPLAMFWLGKKTDSRNVTLVQQDFDAPAAAIEAPLEGAEKLDHSVILARLLGGLMVFIGLYKVWIQPVFLEGTGFDWQFRFINPNFIIFMLFGLAILLHSSFFKFNHAVGKGIGGAAGIMIQFPLYAGIMGIMLSSGLVDVFSSLFVRISDSTTFPLFTFLSAGIVNIFVPSGGGQWLVQGPILIEASQQLGIPMQKSIMALCYGDQITNMLQPFWALPLLGITGLKAKEILPYTFFLLLIGCFIFCSILLIF